MRSKKPSILKACSGFAATPLLACLFFMAKLSSAATPISAISPLQWLALNTTVHGRLRADGAPFARACFQTAEGLAGDADATACAAAQAQYTAAGFREQAYGSYTNPQWETCQATGDSCLLNWQNPADPLAFEHPRVCKPGSVSKYYIEAQEVGDVKAALRFSELTGIRLVIKNTGHDYIGRSSAPDSLTITTRNLKGITYSESFQPEGCHTTSPGVTMGAGTVFHELYQFAEEHGITVVGGTDRTVGASGGWVQGGGHSMLSNNFGLGADRVLQYRVVTPQGKYLTANVCQNTDLFYALRGGGGGTFGVVMESTFLAEPRPLTIQVARVYFPQTRDNWAAVLKISAEHAVRLVEEGWSGLINPNNALLINPVLDATSAEASFKPLADWALSVNGSYTFKTAPSWLTFFDAEIKGNPVGLPGTPASRLVPAKNFATPESRQALVDAILRGPSAGHFKQILISSPYRYSQLNSGEDTSYTPAWRDTIWNVITGYFWNYNTDLETVKKLYKATSAAIQPVRDLTPYSGAYHAEADVHESDHEAAFWGSNYARLLQIKKKYDPHGLLDCWHCVGWKGAQDGRYSCHV